MLNTIRAAAARSVRGAHMMQLEPIAADEAAFARLQEQTGPELARALQTVRNGGHLTGLDTSGRTFRDGLYAEGPFRKGDRIAHTKALAEQSAVG